VSDSRSFDTSSSHWSLLVVDPTSDSCHLTFFHLDSHNSSNSTHASEIAQLITKLHKMGQNQPSSSSSDLLMERNCDELVLVEEIECFQQDNFFDCGICVLINCDLILSHFSPHQTMNLTTKEENMMKFNEDEMEKEDKEEEEKDDLINSDEDLKSVLQDLVLHFKKKNDKCQEMRDLLYQTASQLLIQTISSK